MQTSAKTSLHVVAFNVPYPPDYGGVIDVYYKLKALKEVGVEITLHCFEYGRGERSELLSICKEVFYYKRRKMWHGLFNRWPLIVSSRLSKDLINRLQQDNIPVLYEGLHCCGTLALLAESNRHQMVRIHNNEPEYYEALAKKETNPFKKWYYRSESKRLLAFEQVIQSASLLLTISRQEQDWYASKYPNCQYTGPFHQNEKVETVPGKGTYILYHGNLSVNENIQAVTFLLKEVFPHIKHPVIIAGHEPPAVLQRMTGALPHVTLHANPDQDTLAELIREAQLHTLITFQSTGIKLKLINSLFNGRFCLTNKKMIEQTGLEPFVIQAESASDIISAINETMPLAFTEEMVQKRKEIEVLVSNKRAAELILQHLL